jgi:Holliday junction resolvase
MTGSAASRMKGARAEREIANLHKELGIHAERYGSSRFRGADHDIDLYAFGIDEAALVAELVLVARRITSRGGGTELVGVAQGPA